MKKILLILLALIMIVLQSCSKKIDEPEKNYVYLSEEVFSKLNPSEITKIYVVITISGADPANWEKEYPDIFPITDIETIEKIMQIIATAARNSPLTVWGENIVFETDNTVYYTGIAWSDTTALGDWWESEELYTLLHSLDLPNHKQ